MAAGSGDRGGGAGTFLAVLALVASGAAVAMSMRGAKPGPVEVVDEDGIFDNESLENRLNDVEKRLEEIQRRAEAAERRSSAAEDLARDAMGLSGRALETARGAGTGGGDPTVVEPGGAMSEEDRAAAGRGILDRIREGRFTTADAWPMAEAARRFGVLPRAKDEAEKYAGLRTNDPDAQMLLGAVYTQWILTVPEGPERSPWAQRALDAFEKAVAAAPGNWDARFHRALNLSLWPESLGRRPGALRELEELATWQETQPAPEPRFVETYVVLGDTWLNSGKPEKATEVWQRGLKVFPDSEKLKDRLATNR